MICAARGHDKAGQMLVSAGADVNLVNEGGESALFLTREARGATGALARSLLRAGAADHWQWIFFEAPIVVHSKKTATKRMTYLEWMDLQRPNQPNTNSMKRMSKSYIAIWRRATENALASFRRAGVSLDTQDFKGIPLLHRVVKFGAPPEVLEMILKRGALPNAKDKDGNSLLHILALNKRIRRLPEYVEVLAAAGADLDTVNGDNETALLCATRCAASIIRRSDQVPGETVSSNTYPWLEFVEELANAGASLEAKTSGGETAIMLVNKREDVLEILLRAGADTNARDTTGQAAAHRAASNAKPSCIAALITAGADLNVRDSTGATPIHMAVSSGNLSVVSALIDAGADVNVRDDSGNRPLYLAVSINSDPLSMEDHYGVAAALVEAGADVNARGKDGRHPLSVLRTSWRFKNAARSEVKGDKTNAMLELERLMIAAGALYDESEDAPTRIAYDRSTGGFTKVPAFGSNNAKEPDSPVPSGFESPGAPPSGGGARKATRPVALEPQESVTSQESQTGEVPLDESSEFFAMGKGKTASDARSNAFKKIALDVLNAVLESEMNSKLTIEFRRSGISGNYAAFCKALMQNESFSTEDLVPVQFLADENSGVFEASIVLDVSLTGQMLNDFITSLQQIYSSDWGGYYSDPKPSITNLGIRFQANGEGDSVDEAVRNSVDSAVDQLQSEFLPLLFAGMPANERRELVTPANFSALVFKGDDRAFEQFGERIRVTTDWVLDLQLLQDSANRAAKLPKEAAFGDSVTNGPAPGSPSLPDPTPERPSASSRAVVAGPDLEVIRSKAVAVVSMMKNYAGLNDCMQVDEYTTKLLELDKEGVTEGQLWKSAQAAMSCKACRRRILEAIVRRFPDGSRTRFAKMELELE
jgi:ankyrin repeat protein